MKQRSRGSPINAAMLCSHDGCLEPSMRSTPNKPPLCRTHRLKAYKEKYKKKKEMEAVTAKLEAKIKEGLEMTVVPPSDLNEESPDTLVLSPSLLEQVLNEKKQSLLLSPDVITFLRVKQDKFRNSSTTKKS
ncbi:PREDICTED: regulatory factor X-associated protein-like [Priapulus caudatus]|uniref:Regulatory factor X-associated protein-like n=1 Tax=Priapulus caudatus TaxID=37621 RepID=A0ABM1DZ68_PRICU|nr:PREDICTED: regulatory factor X-associated protein-like [Priapulus caudatus]